MLTSEQEIAQGCATQKSGDTPTVAQVIVALRAAEVAMTRKIVLGQRGTINDDSLHIAALQKDAIGLHAAAFIAARASLNKSLDTNWSTAADSAALLGNALATKLFGQPVPGAVTLPCHEHGRSRQERVLALRSVRQHENGDISGVVQTQNSTRDFIYTLNKAYFQEDISI